MITISSRLGKLSESPDQPATFEEWLTGSDALAFLRQNEMDDEFVVYAADQHTFIHSLIVPL